MSGGLFREIAPKNGSYVLQKVRETDYGIHRIKNWIYELQKLTVTQNWNYPEWLDGLSIVLLHLLGLEDNSALFDTKDAKITKDLPKQSRTIRITWLYKYEDTNKVMLSILNCIWIDISV